MMRLWYLPQLIHARHNMPTYRLYKLYKITHRLYQLYLNTNYILPFPTPATASQYCKICNMNASLLHEYFSPPTPSGDIHGHCAHCAIKSTCSLEVGLTLRHTSNRHFCIHAHTKDLRAVFGQHRMEMLTRTEET